MLWCPPEIFGAVRGGNGNGKGNVNNARLKSESRRLLQIQIQSQRRPPKGGRYKFKIASAQPFELALPVLRMNRAVARLTTGRV
jgi:hypothetical protein